LTNGNHTHPFWRVQNRLQQPSLDNE
jgi:hypothetical protein